MSWREVRDDWSKLRVPAGEPAGVKTAGPSVVAVVWCIKRPFSFCSLGMVCWKVYAAW